MIEKNPLPHRAIDKFLIPAALIVLVLISFYLINSAWPFNTDDAYITLRYSRNLVEGAGITWNATETPVEGYSNFLHVLIGAFSLTLGLNPISVFKVIGALSLFGTFLCIIKLCQREVSRLMAFIPCFFLLGHQGEVYWSVSGLETSFFQCLCLLGLVFLFESQSKLRSTWITLIALAICLTRTEGIAFALSLISFFVIKNHIEKRKEPGTYVSIVTFGALFLIYSWWRFEHFESLLSNVALCKMGFETEPFKLIREFLFYAIQLLPFALFSKFSLKTLALWSFVFIQVGISYKLDPIIGDYQRHFMIAVPCLLVLATLGMSRISHWVFPELPRDQVEAVLTVLLLMGLIPMYWPLNRWLEVATLDYSKRMEVRKDVAEWLNTNISAQDSFVVGDSGLIAYLAKARAIDAFCLNSKTMTSPEINKNEELFANWILSEKPRAIIVHSSTPETLTPRTEYKVFTLLTADPRFSHDYEEGARFLGKDDFNYFVFKRRAGV